MKLLLSIMSDVRKGKRLRIEKIDANMAKNVSEKVLFQFLDMSENSRTFLDSLEVVSCKAELWAMPELVPGNRIWTASCWN